MATFQNDVVHYIRASCLTNYTERGKGKGEPRNRPRKTHRVSGSIVQLFLNLGTRRRCVVSITPRPSLPRERPSSHCTGGWVGPEPVWIGAENLAPQGFDPWTFQPVASHRKMYYSYKYVQHDIKIPCFWKKIQYAM